MSKSSINAVITVMIIIFVLFFAGSFAYENFRIQQSDRMYEQRLDKDMEQAEKDSQSGQTNEESRNN